MHSNENSIQKESKMNLEVMTIQHYTDVHALWSRTPGLGLHLIEDSLEGISIFLNRNPDTCFIAQEDGKLIGTILAGHDGRRGYLYHLAIDPAYRKKGFGRQLTEQALAALKKLGIQKVALVAFADKKQAIPSGKRWDFVHAGILPIEIDLLHKNAARRDAVRPFSVTKSISRVLS